MSTEGRRPERVAEMVLRELSAMLLRDLKDPRLNNVTLMSVEMTDDLRLGRVFFSSLEGASRADSVVAGFESASGFIGSSLPRAFGHLLQTAPLEA